MKKYKVTVDDNGSESISEFSSILSKKIESIGRKKEKFKAISYFSLFRCANSFDKFAIATGSFCMVICGVIQPFVLLLFGQFSGDIIDYATNIQNATDSEMPDVRQKLYDRVIYYAICYCSAGISTFTLSYIGGALVSYSAIRQITLMRTQFLQKILNLDIEWHDLHQTGDFSTSFTENLSKIEEGIGEKITIFIYYQTTALFCAIFSFYKGWKLTLICMVYVVLALINFVIVIIFSEKFSKKEAGIYSRAAVIAEEVLSSIRTVVAFDGQAKEINRYEKPLIEAKDSNLLKACFNGLSEGLIWLILYGSLALTFWFGIGLLLDERHLPIEERVYTPGNMMSIYFCGLNSGWNVINGMPFLEVFGNARGAASKIFSILDTEPNINKSKENGKIFESFKGDIIFKNVFFNYPSRPDVKVLEDFSLQVCSGQTVALVGSSGCGKSTCVQLLQRFYDPVKGNVYIDDHDIRHLNLRWLRDQIGIVGQEPALFATTIKENIKYGKPNATQAEIEAAAKKANAHNFIKNLPKGYDTTVGEKGTQLSGGQKQRIAIARALVRQPRILLLDEATSALDTTSEAEVQAALDSISHECTTIIVAHRLSTIRNANKIVVVSEGTVIEEGNHSELMKLKGVYFNLVKSNDTDIEEEENVSGNVFQLESQTSIESLKSQISISSTEQTQGAQGDNETVQEAVKSSISEVMKANKPEWMYISLGCIASIVYGACLPVYAVLFGNILGILSSSDDHYIRNQTNILCLYFLILGIVACLAKFILSYSFGVSGETLTLRLRKQMFEKMINQEVGWFDKIENGVGALGAKLSNEASSVQSASGSRIGAVLSSCSTFILAVTLSLYYEWRLTLVMISFAPIIIMAIYFQSKIESSEARVNQKALEGAAQLASESISNIRTVASLSCEEIFQEKYIKAMDPYLKVAKVRLHFRAIVIACARSVIFFADIAGIAYGVKLIIEENLDYGLVFNVIEAIITGSWSISHAFAFSSNFSNALVSAGSIFKLLRREAEIKNIENASTKSWNKTTVDYKSVNFAYPTRPSSQILTGLDLSIMEGKTVALVGSSGSGKSTLIQLLERFYEPQMGEVDIDDADIKTMNLVTLRSRLGIVSQEPNLFDRTIAENIAYGNNQRVVTMDEIISAAKNANIHNFITSLPMGYETRLGSKGAQLSGGQKQRIAIARALVREPSILLLDEATSALDNESEKIVQEALEKAMVNRTCITIAHKLTTIQDADMICVIQNGKVVESGKHGELIGRKGAYYEFYKLQSGKR